MNKLFTFFICILLVGSISTMAMALGVGVYTTARSGRPIKELGNKSYGPSEKISLDGGFMIDSCVAKDNLFNNRFKIGYGRNIGGGMLFERVSLSNTFGFGVVRSKIIRFWMGPQLLLGYRWKNYSKTKPGIGFAPDMATVMISNNKKYDLGEIALGAVIGLNINMGEFVTLGIDGGFRYSTLLGYEKNMWQKEASFTYGSGYELFGNVGILFRVNDSFSAKNES